MKKQVILLMFLMAFGTFSLQAQTKKTKVAVINTQVILQLMPEYDSASVAMQEKYAQMEQQLQMMMSELQEKQQAYKAQMDSLTPMWRSMREQEIQDLTKRTQDFQQNAQQELTDFQNKLIAKILEKITVAVKEVSKEQGYTHVIDNSQQVLLYFDESFDITDLVKKKLNLKDKPLPTGGATGM
jgi:outer membrane protein